MNNTENDIKTIKDEFNNILKVVIVPPDGEKAA